METTRQITLEENEVAQALFGEHHRNLKRIEQLTEVGIRTRGNVVDILGPETRVVTVERLIRELYRLIKGGYRLAESDIEPALNLVRDDPRIRLDRIYNNGVPVAGARKMVTPKGLVQKEYLEAIRKNDIVFSVGPAGTGKTYLAMAMAVSSLNNGEVERIVLTRPAVEAGERLGFLPGDIVEKVSPYLRPLYDALYDMMELEKARALMDKGVIEVAPLAFMRGRSLNHAFVILDEAQNTTKAQMKMFLTRLGYDSKAVVTGDVTQIDLPAGETSGLKHARLILAGIPGIHFTEFSERDVVRHPLVQKIILAYEKEERAKYPADEEAPDHEQER
ncbi:MAG TPA: PhoH family protein [bacterium]|nr:PhoH family protein [bacterium]